MKTMTMTRYLSSAIGRKVLMGLTGLVLLGFLAQHLVANLPLLGGDGEAFNAYAYSLEGNPLIIAAELFLIAVFIGHFATGIALTARNRRARAQGYQVTRSAGAASRRSVASRTMILSGIVLLIFIPIHVRLFKFGGDGPAPRGPVRDLHGIVIEHFSNPLLVAWYVAVMGVVGLHLWHGASSALESLGVAHRQGLRRGLRAAITLMMAGFALIPLLVLAGVGR